MTIRPVIELSELQQCVELQRTVWGLEDIDVVPTRMFVTQNRIGGLVLGAFDGGQLVGFLSSMPGCRDGVPYWYSQMLAVAPEYRNHGIGVDLKRAQRDHARQRGLHFIEWTFDPLESKNAYLNLVKLGAIARRYYVNLYGATASELQEGLESDRLVAEWWIDRPRVDLEGDIRRVKVPADIQTLKKQHLKSAQDIQLQVREQFTELFAADYFVAGFERGDEWGEYLLAPGGSRVYQAN
jgi:predicted GNAT superfamily acetyltransferase